MLSFFVTLAFAFVTFVLTPAFAFIQMLQAERKQSVCSKTIGQEQPLVACRPTVWPQNKKEGSVYKEDRTGNRENSRFMRPDDFPGICESSHSALPFPVGAANGARACARRIPTEPVPN